MNDPLFDLPAPPADTFTVDYQGRPSVLTVESIGLAAGQMTLRAQAEGEPGETKTFTRQSAGMWRWPPDRGWAALVAAEVAEWMERHWSAAGGAR